MTLGFGVGTMLPPSAVVGIITLLVLAFGAWFESAVSPAPPVRRVAMWLTAVLLTAALLAYTGSILIGLLQHKPASWYQLGGVDNQKEVVLVLVLVAIVGLLRLVILIRRLKAAR